MLEALSAAGIPLDDLTDRRLERVALAVLACGDIKSVADFKSAKSITDGYGLRTKGIVEYMNAHYGENLSKGGYDDVKRKDLEMPLLGDIVLGGQVAKLKDPADPNNPTRQYTLSQDFAALLANYGTSSWSAAVTNYEATHTLLRDRLESIGQKKVSTVRNAKELIEQIHSVLGTGPHNELIVQVITEFLPRFGYGADVLYVGSATDRFLHVDTTKFQELNFPPPSRGTDLPDVVAYSSEKNWLYFIEAVHSYGPISPNRLLKIEALVKESQVAGAVFVNAFQDLKTYMEWHNRKAIPWETEVWLAEAPSHMIHMDGVKFLGPFKTIDVD